MPYTSNPSIQTLCKIVEQEILDLTTSLIPSDLINKISILKELPNDIILATLISPMTEALRLLSIIRKTALGFTFAPGYVNYVGFFERSFVFNTTKRNPFLQKIFKRFRCLDDIFCIFQGTSMN